MNDGFLLAKLGWRAVMYRPWIFAELESITFAAHSPVRFRIKHVGNNLSPMYFANPKALPKVPVSRFPF